MSALYFVFSGFTSLLLCCSSVTKSHPTICNPMDCSTPVSPIFSISGSLLKFVSIESVRLSNHLILCRPILLPSVFPIIRVFSSESALHIRWPKYCSFSFSLNPAKGYSGLISFRIGWFDRPAVQGTLRDFSNTTVRKLQFSGI